MHMNYSYKLVQITIFNLCHALVPVVTYFISDFVYLSAEINCLKYQ